MPDRRYPVSLAALVVACAALIVAVAFAVGGGPPSKPGDVIAAGSGQQHLVEGAAAAENPGCAPAQGAGHMGVCAQNRGALKVANVLAPQGNKVPASHGSSSALGAVLGLFETDAAVAAGPVDRGEDVYEGQGCSIDWSARRRYLSYAHFKDGESTGHTDACVTYNARSARAAHLPFGTYYFDRTYANPTVEADRAAAIDRSAGASPTQPGVLPHTVDAETNDAGLSQPAACAHVSAYIVRYERDTGRAQMEVYTSIGTSPFGQSCPLLPPGTIVWDAAYGPSWNVIAGQQPCEWQYSDGTYGPTPHLDGGDSDIWLCSRSRLLQLANAQPPLPPPLAAHYTRCGTLRYLRSHGQAHTAQAGDVRNSLMADRIACPDHTAVRTARPPRLPQPSPGEFRECRDLLAWRRGGRPAARRPREMSDRARLMRAGIRCDGKPPLVAVR